jgi:predicted N-acetyltransferase YhbS
MTNDANLAQRHLSDARFYLQLIEESKMPPEKDGAIRQLLCDCFPEDAAIFSQTRYWHGSAPAFSWVQEDQGRITGHVGVVVRAITCGSQAVRVGGIQNLAVRPEQRGTGLSQALMTQSMIEAKSRGLDHGLLFCVPALRRFYESLGWFIVETTVVILDGQGAKTSLDAKNICMALCLGSSPFPAGPIDLQGADW